VWRGDEFKEAKDPEPRIQEFRRAWLGEGSAGGEPLWNAPGDLVIFLSRAKKAKISG
jgi:hypothetical protein